MAEIAPTEVMDGDFLTRLSAKIDGIVARLTAARHMGEIKTDLKPRLMALAGPNPVDFRALSVTYGRLALETGADAEWKNIVEPPDVNTVADKPQIAWLATQAWNKVEPWTGHAADAFDTYILQFLKDKPVVSRQRIMINTFQLASEAHQAIYIKSRQDVWNLVASVDTAVDQALDHPCASTPIILTIIAAVATVTSIGGLTWAAVAAAGSAGASITGAKAPSPKDREIDASDLYSIRDSVLAIVAEMEADMAEAETMVRTTVQGFTAVLDRFSSTGQGFIGPSVHTNGESPIHWNPDATGSLPDSYVDEFLPPSATE